MIQLISKPWYREFSGEIQEMHLLRHRVFNERLNWDVPAKGGFEIDTYDADCPDYLIMKGATGRIEGCVRFLPTTGPTMLRDTFSNLLDGRSAPEHDSILESSRFALDLPAAAPKGHGGIAVGTYELFAGMVEFALSRGSDRIVTVTDTRMERILRIAGWPLERLGSPKPIGNTMALAGFVDVSKEILDSLRERGGGYQPVLWAPVVHLNRED
ncbi:conjugal transfer protein TraI [Roseibium algicola]|uniref:Acyl-homoserine-lactone synthase n=1 Tax=Roseibium algicola TaxID=2857014 RepID=A0ABN4WY62_9HYPH|nr:acyl-homoserine-lactone synthase [Roseibium aggregatum]AQQ05383.1 conjugal transfer protein TraI [Roseibium aggregatum]